MVDADGSQVEVPAGIAEHVYVASEAPVGQPAG